MSEIENENPPRSTWICDRCAAQVFVERCPCCGETEWQQRASAVVRVRLDVACALAAVDRDLDLSMRAVRNVGSMEKPVYIDRGDWFQTYTGAMFYICDPCAGEVRFDDIAHSLSMQCRFNGHTREFYSVAQHSVLVAECLSARFGETNAKWLRTAIFHDAAEAYMGDMVRPLKKTDAHFRAVEARLEEAIAERFDLIYPMPDLIKRADNALLIAERDRLMSEPPRPWNETGDPYDAIDECWDPATAERRFRIAAAEYVTPR